MGKFCGNCGKKMIVGALFCGHCGMRKRSVQAEVPKKILTKKYIEEELHRQKNSIWAYLGQLLLLVGMFVVLALGSPAIFICIIPWGINVFRMIRGDIRRAQMKYYVLERQCIAKQICETDDGNCWQIWFDNNIGDAYVALEVEEDFFEATEEGEEFYVVFLLKDRTPCSCYRKSEWQIQKNFGVGYTPAQKTI